MDIEFHVHTYASLLIVGSMLAQNLRGKHDQLVVYTSRFLNKAKRNCNTIEHEILAMVFALHKLKITYLLISLCSMLIIWIWSI